MTIGFIAATAGGQSSYSGGFNTSSVVVPTSAQEGDLLLAICDGNNGYSPVQSGWNDVDGGFWRVATSADPGATYSWETPGNLSTYLTVGLAVYRPSTGTVVTVATVSNSFTAPSVTTTAAAQTVVSMWVSYSSGGITPPAGVTSRYEVTGVSGVGSVTVADTIQASAGASPTETATGAMGVLTAASFVVNGAAAPNAPTQLTPSGTTVNNTITERLAWLYSNPASNDTQSQFDLQWRHQGSSDAWNTISQTTPNSYWDAPGGTFPAETIEWQVRTYDQGGLVGPWSALDYFTAAAPTGTPTITAPMSGGTIGLTPNTVSWSAPSQQGYQVRTVADDGTGNPNTAVVYTDTGQVTDTDTRSIQVAYTTNNIVVHTQVRVEQNSLWSSWADVSDTVSYTPPAVPTLTVSPNSTGGTITISPTQPTPTGGEPTVTSIDIWCRTATDSPYGDPQRPPTTGVRIVAGIPPSTAWVDYAPASGVIYEYQVVANGSNTTTSASAWTA